MQILALSCLEAFLAPPVTALLCRHRVTRGKKVSYRTAVAGAYIADLLVLCIVLIGVARFEIWTLEYWTAIVIGYGLLGLFAVLPALGVVHYYQRRTKSNEAPVA
jgi:hypothetical protein